MGVHPIFRVHKILSNLLVIGEPLSEGSRSLLSVILMLSPRFRFSYWNALISYLTSLLAVIYKFAEVIFGGLSSLLSNHLADNLH